VTPGTGRCIHRFFDTSPISPSGRYLAVFRMPFEDRQPAPGDAGQIVLIDLAKGIERCVADTCGWEPQTGANINWGATNEELYFNDVDTTTWQPFAWRLNPLTGARQRLQGTVYHASSDGRWLISANLTSMRRTQPGYGVRVPDTHMRWNVGPADDDGFYLTDTASGESRLLVSIRDLIERATPPIQIGDASQYEIYGFHSKFNPQGDRHMLSLRWYPQRERGDWDAFATPSVPVRYAWVTMRLDGSDMHCAIGPEQWDKGGHHGTWFPDGWRISMNLNIDRDCMRLVQTNADGTGLRKIHNTLHGSGHPTVHPDNRHILTDTYDNKWEAYGDGTIPLRWLDIKTGAEQHLVRINVHQPVCDPVLRVDAHPAWDRTWRYITFNAFVGGTRRVFIADLKRVLR
jgi:hypothetical protein